MPWLISLALIVLALGAAFVGRDRLRVKHDYFFLLFVGQALVYVLIVPSLNVTSASAAVAQDYLRLQVSAGLLFVLPIILTYRLLAGRFQGSQVRTAGLEVTEARAAIFALLLIAFDLVFLVVAVQNDMVIRRVGTYPLAERQASLHPLALLIIRSHDLISLPILGYLLFLQIRLRSTPGPSPRAMHWLLAPLVVGTLVLMFTAVTSSRGAVILASAFLLGAFFFYSVRPVVRSLLPVALPVALLTVYLLLLVPNVRTYMAPDSPRENPFVVLFPLYAIERYVPAATRSPITTVATPSASPATASPPAVIPTSVATPSASPATASSPAVIPTRVGTAAATSDERIAAYIEEGFIRRLDCVDLIQRMEPSLARSGYEFGAAWRVPAFIALTQFVAPSASEEYKRTARTTAKSYLLERHTELDPGDYYSCALTDLFGNFGIAGFPFGAGVLGLAFVVTRRVMRGGVPILGNHGYWIGLLLVAHLLSFEQESATFLFGWIRYLPAAVAVFLINPVTVSGNRPALLYVVGGLLRRR
jgi:hypothetical protein